LTTEDLPVDTRGPILTKIIPNSLVFANTKGASIDCTASGLPKPRLNWIQKDGTLVTDIPKILQLLPNNTLYFLPFEPDDFNPAAHSQEYRCIAENKVGKIFSRPMRITAVVVDRYKVYNVQLNDVWVISNGTAILKCLINPRFVNEYIKVTKWTKNSMPVTEGGRISVMPNGELHIRNVQKSDGTLDYRCLTRNILTRYTKTSPTASIHVYKPPVIWKTPKIEPSDTALVMQAGTTAELPCVATGNPLPNYDWTKQNIKIERGSNKYDQKGGNLVIRNLRVTDTALYKCTAFNKKGSTSVSLQLTVTSPLKATLYPSYQIVDAGHMATFNCSVQGSPVKNITWYHNGRPFTNISRTHIIVDNWLQLPAVNRNDQGMYQCIAGNDVDTAQATGELRLGAAHPAFLETFDSVLVQPGSNFTFKCAVSGNPTPTIRWTLDDEPIYPSDVSSFKTYATEQADVVSVLHITNIQVQTGGEYQCIGSNNVGEISHVARANVYGVPYVRVLQNITATAKQPLVIKCYVSGYPIGSITWFKSSQALPIDHRQKVVNGTLTVEDIQSAYDEGEYRCTATNSKDEGMSRNVLVQIVEPPSITPFSFQKKTRAGQRVTVICGISSGETPIVLGWLKDGQTIPAHLGITIQPSEYTSLLLIKEANPRHNGNYTCYANNSVGYDSHTASLVVYVPPQWVIQPKDSFVVLGKSVLLSCKTTGIPTPSVIWQKAKGRNPGNYVNLNYTENTLVSSGSGNQRMQLLENGTLLITSSEETDDGYYLCRARNGIGYPLSRVVQLTVHIPARYEGDGQRNYTVKKSGNSTMECKASGDEPIFVTWRFGSDTVNSQTNLRLRVENIGTISRLHVASAVREDSGVYVCNAENKYGYGETTRRLIVVEPPEPPINLKLKSRSSRSVNISWQEPYDGNSPITEYVLQFKNESDIWKAAPSNVTVTTADQVPEGSISGLHPSYKYHIRALAINTIGTGSASAVITVSTDEEVPSGPPTDIRVQASGSTSLKVTWRTPLYDQQNGKILGYYIGYKRHNSSDAYVYVKKLTENNSDLEQQIRNLLKFTRYNLHVRAFNSKGPGPISMDVTAFTLEDVPSLPPQNVRIRNINSDNIRLSWTEPPYYTVQGVLQGYKVLYKEIRADEDETEANYISSSKLETVVPNLKKFTNYSIQVLAYTIMGEGVRSKPLHIKTKEDIPSQPPNVKVITKDRNTVLLLWEPPVNPNGILTKYIIRYSNTSRGPPNTKSPKLEIKVRRTSHLISRLLEGQEYMFTVSACTRVGESLPSQVVRATPTDKVKPQDPILVLASSTTSTIQINWKSRHNGGSKLKGFDIKFKKEHGEWQTLKTDSMTRTHMFKGLKCGTGYRFIVNSFNLIGVSDDSVQISAKTNGSSPVMPAQDLVLQSVNSSFVQLDLSSWRSGGCPIKFYTVKYRMNGQTEWVEVSNNVDGNMTSFTVRDLRPATWYWMKLTAHNEAGSTERLLKFGTLTYSGSTIRPLFVVHRKEGKFYEKNYVMIPLCAGIIVVLVGAVAVILWCRKRSERLRFKETASNLRRDITAETSLMNDLDKRLNLDMDCGGGMPESFCKRNLSLLTSTTLPELMSHNGRANGSVGSEKTSWLYHTAYPSRDGAKSSGDICFSPNRAGIAVHPWSSEYAATPTLCYTSNTAPRTALSYNTKPYSSNVYDTTTPYASVSVDAYDVNPYATINQLSITINPSKPGLHANSQSSDEDTVGLEKAAAQRQLRAPPLSLRPRMPYPNSLSLTKPPRKKKDCFENKGGSQRHSVISSVTTVSSSRDELLEAYENAKRAQRIQPIVYETRPDFSPQPTDSSSTTEPGIREFTQSPPKPDERREASCEVPAYEQHRHHKDFDAESDTTECDMVHTRDRSPPRRARGRHKGKQKGQVVSKRNLGIIPRTHSRTSTTSTNSEEVTYAFCSRDYPSLGSPTEGFNIYSSAPHPCTDFNLDEDNLSKSRSSIRSPVHPRKNAQNGRNTPHSKLRYDINVDRPGSEEIKPLVRTQNKTPVTAPQIEQDHISIIDRRYRPVKDPGPLPPEPPTRIMLERLNHNYTTDYTIV
ncbi:Down syndrome cell adhesion molecule-like isoform X2, partial [Argonauta hians]